MTKRSFSHLLTVFTAALVAAGCADTGGGGGGGAADAGAADATKSDTGAGSDTTAADTGGGQSVTVKEMQEEMEKLDCTANSFTNGPKGVTINDLVVVSQISFKFDSKKTLNQVYVQSKGGGLWSGIQVVAATDTVLSKLTIKIGDVISVTGDITDFYCFTQFKASKVTVKAGATELPVAVTVTADKIGSKAGIEDNEAAESVFVSIENVVVSDAAPLGSDDKTHGDFYVGKDENDKAILVVPGFATTFSKETSGGAYANEFKKGQVFSSIRGVLVYSFSVWRLTPVNDAGLSIK